MSRESRDAPIHSLLLEATRDGGAVIQATFIPKGVHDGAQPKGPWAGAKASPTPAPVVALATNPLPPASLCPSSSQSQCSRRPWWWRLCPSPRHRP